MVEATEIVSEVIELMTEIFRAYSIGSPDKSCKPGARSIVPASLVVCPVGTNTYVEANTSFDWQRDGLPIVAAYRERLAVFLHEPFGDSFILACAEMRKTRQLPLDRYGTRDATSHHELLQKIVQRVIECVDSQKPIFALHDWLRRNYHPYGCEWIDDREQIERDAKGLNRLVPLLREERVRADEILASKRPASDSKSPSICSEWPAWLPPIGDQEKLWLWPLIQKQPDFCQTLTREQRAVVGGYVVALPSTLDADVIDVSWHYAEPSQWPRRQRNCRSGHFGYGLRLPSPQPYDVGVFLRSVLEFSDSKGGANAHTVADDLLQFVLTIGQRKPFPTIPNDSAERKQLDVLDEELGVECSKLGLVFPTLDLGLNKSLTPFGWSHVPSEPSNAGLAVHATDGWQKAMRILARQLKDVRSTNPASGQRSRETGTEQVPAMIPASEINGNEPSKMPIQIKPPEYLFGWGEILLFLKRPDERKERERIQRMNDELGGPITKPAAKGAQPMVDKEKLGQWWCDLEDKQRDLVAAYDAARNDVDATVGKVAQQRYAKSSIVLPEIDGSIKLRKVSKGPEG